MIPLTSPTARPLPPPLPLPAADVQVATAEALAALIPMLGRTARALTRDADRAEDLTQEALLRVWSRLRDGERIDDLRPYALATLRNLARRPPRLAPAEAAAPESSAPDADDRIAVREVLAALAGLPGAQARLLATAATGGGTLAEIAAEAGVPPGTVASRVSRARARLRAELDLPATAPVAALLGR